MHFQFGEAPLQVITITLKSHSSRFLTPSQTMGNNKSPVTPFVGNWAYRNSRLENMPLTMKVNIWIATTFSTLSGFVHCHLNSVSALLTSPRLMNPTSSDVLV